MKMSQLGTVYATKRRRRNGKSIKTTPKEGITKSNPSKRHRERLNAELDLLASLLPFEQNILSKLDRLSILRLSVSYLRIKSYFQVVMHKEKNENGMMSNAVSDENYRTRDFTSYDHSFVLDSETFLQALNGFIMILTCDGEVFFATHTIESYLGFHQSDIIHQSVYELVHSEDREELQKQLLWNSFLPADLSGIQLTEALVPEKDKLLERSFTVRFRCLLDNTSGFLRLDIRGRVKILHGQNKKNEEPPLALFAFCTPFGPPSLLEIPPKENMFKSKHKLDFSLVSMDHKGKNTLGYSDSELANMGGYDLVHYDDLAYVASAHQELLKTGASGMIAYRYQKKDGAWQWLQTSSRLVYKNSKPDFVICTHRQLMEEEGRDLLGKRTMDFKVSYLDAGISSTYFDSDQLIVSPNNLNSPSSPTTSQQRANRRYKTQLRDFLSTCRHKRKMNNQCTAEQVSPTVSVVDYISGGPPGTAAAAAAVAAAAYTNTINSVYSPSAHFPGTGPDNVYMTAPVHSPNFYPMPDNLFHQYRLQGVSGYYPEYHTSTTASTFVSTNGLIPYDSYGITKEDSMRWHDGGKNYGAGSESNQSHSSSGLVAEPIQQELSSLSVERYLVSGIGTASTNDKIPSHTIKSSSQMHLNKHASPVHSLEELVDPCCSTESMTPSVANTVVLGGTKESIERRKQHEQLYQNNEQQRLQSTHQRLVHHRLPMSQLPTIEQHSTQPQLIHNDCGHNCRPVEHKLSTKSPTSLSPIHSEPPRQTVLMWGTSYTTNRKGPGTNINRCNNICGNELPRNSDDGTPSYEYVTVNNFHDCSINSTSLCTVIDGSGEHDHHNSTNMANRKPDACNDSDAVERGIIEKRDDSESQKITKSSDASHMSLMASKKENPQPSAANKD